MAQGPAMVHFKEVKTMKLSEVSNEAGSKAFMETIVHSNVPGKQMQAGIFQLDPGPSFPYTYCYESIVLVLTGDFTVKHASLETPTNLKAGDSMYIPVGCKLEYSAGEANSRLYFVIQPPQAEDCARVQAGLTANPAPTLKQNIPALKIIDDIPLLPNDSEAKAYLEDFLRSEVKGKEMTSGLYKVFNGPYHDYLYDYEEFKYIIEGQLNLKDGTGQSVVAKAGDLMYFPNGVPINFGTEGEYGLGFFVGQRAVGSA